MILQKVGLFAALGLIASCGAAMAMAPAQAKPGYEAGGELGVSLTSGTKIAGAADLDYGIKTNLLQSTYSDLFVDFLSVGRNVGPFNLRGNLLTAGIRQPLPVGGTTPISVEGGLSYLNTSVDGGGSSSNTSGFIGGRATFAQSGQIGLNVMGRYHFESGGFYQVGAGIFGPFGKGTGTFYQIDYYHIGGTGGANTDTILVGLRFGGKG